MHVQAEDDMTPSLSHGKACFKLLQANKSESSDKNQSLRDVRKDDLSFQPLRRIRNMSTGHMTVLESAKLLLCLGLHQNEHCTDFQVSLRTL